MKKGMIAACLAGSLLAGCASGYKEFYTALPPGRHVEEPLPYTGEPELVASSGDTIRDGAHMWTEGYMVIGFSAFNGPQESRDAALKQAKAVGARYVVVSSKYASTVNLSIPVSTPTTSTSYTSGRVSSGSASGTYTAKTTTYGSSTSHIPYEVDRYHQEAGYLAPMARKGLGTLVLPLQPEDAARLGTNKGVRVLAVRRGSPAYDADILPDDVLLSIAGQEIFDRDSYRAAYRAALGKPATVLILRRGARIPIEVPLSADGSW